MKAAAWQRRLTAMCMALALGSTAVSAAQPPLETLSAEERAYLQSHPRLRISNEADWPPFDFYENGQPQGYSVELMRLIADKLGLQAEFVPAGSWDQLVDDFCAGKIDLLHPTDQPEKVKRCGLFTAPIIRETSQFVTRKDIGPIRGIADLLGRTVATPTGWEQTEMLRRLYGDRLSIVETRDLREAIEAVRDGRADFTTDFGSALRYHVDRGGFTDLTVQGIWDREDKAGGLSDLYIAVPIAKPLLHSAVAKALAAVTAEQKRALRARWLDAGSPAPPRLTLSAAEQAYLRAHPLIRVKNSADYAPFDFIVGGQPQGYAIDLLQLLAERIGLRLEFVSGDVWSEQWRRFQAGEIDLLHSLTISPEREQAALFSAPYLRWRSLFVVRAGAHKVASLAELHGRTMAVVEGTWIDRYIASQHPGIRRLPVGSNQAMLDAVARGDADAAATAEPTLRYLLRQQGRSDLEPAGWARELDAEGQGQGHYFAGRRDAPELIALLDKALASLTTAELQALQAKWFGEGIGGSARPAARQLPLDAEQRRYLAAKKTLAMCVDPDWMPYERVTAAGDYEGISADIIRLIGERLGVPIEHRPTPSWTESLAAIRRRDCDLLPSATDTPSRRDTMNFTTPVFVEPYVVATRGEELYLRGAEDIGQRRVAIVRGYAIGEQLGQRFPEIPQVEVGNAAEGIGLVQDGGAWGFVDSMASVAYHLTHARAHDLKIAGRLEFDHEYAIASRNDEPQLAELLQLALDSISEDERREVFNRWVQVRYEQGVDYTLLWRLALATGLLLAGFYGWNRKLARMNIKVQRSQAQTQAAHDQLLAAQQQLVLQEKMASLGTLTAGVAHEINNPVNFADGAVQNLEVELQRLQQFIRELAGDDAPAEVLAAFASRFKRLQEMTATAREGHERIKAIVRDLRQFSRLDEAERKRIRLSEPIRSTVHLIRTRFDRVSFALDLDIDPEIECQPAKLGQALMNVIVNACEAASAHRGEDRAFVRVATAVDREHAVIHVVDNGAGMDDAVRARIFDPFFTTKGVGSGTGLGLAITLGIIRDHGGQIDVESSPGQGCRVRITLPLAGVAVASSVAE